MNEITSKLETLESILIKADAPVLRRLNPGLKESEIAAFFSENNIPTHPDLFSLYNWHNGLTSIYGEYQDLTEFSPLGSFPNLNEMLALRDLFMLYDYDIEIENRHEYVPFLSGGEDDMRLLRVSSGEIYYWSPGIQVWCEKCFHSLSSMLDLILKCYEVGALKIHSVEGLIVDDEYWKLKEEFET
jgi:hypothetical protein